jgi:hypothetical protein
MIRRVPMKSLQLLVLALLVPFCGLRAQVSTAKLANAEGLGKTVYGVGLAAGPASGIGVSFRAHLPNKSSFQGIFGIIKTSDKLSLSVGGEYQYDLVRSNATRFFFGPGISYFYSGSSHNEIAGPFRAGIGLGGEINIRDVFHVTIEGMYVFFSDGSVLPLPQISAHYYFY